ncbi:MAG: TonB-dependent receptor [Bacteroidota bacterium]
MKRILLLLICAATLAYQQEKAVLSGFVRDKANKESLPFANVYIKQLKIGAATNIEGYYAIPNIPEGEYEVQYSLLGYQPQTVLINTMQNKRIVQDIYLSDQSVQISEVVINAEAEEEKRTTQTGRIVLQARDIATLPTIGEADVFRALQLMPGVKATSEISSGLNVRGGSTDQNLILLDGTVVYNPSHLFGFFSTFNNDAIKDIDLMKGGFPAEYGGRLSSVLNVTNIDGDRVNTHGKASISLLSTRVTGEGPLGNGSWFLSGRRTYFDQFVAAAKLDTGKDAIPLYYFYDANAKLNQDFDENDKVSFVGYLGQDDLKFALGQNELSINMRWGNRTGALKWTHVFNQTLFSNFTASYSRYVSRTIFNFGGTGFAQSNSINDFSLKGDLDFFWTNDHLIKIGAWWSQYRVTYTTSGDGDPYEFLERPAQASFYVQDEWRASERWTLQGGVRVEYQDLSKQTGVGPRFNARYNVDESSSIKFATGLYYQFLMAVPAGSDNGFSPFDIWVPINKKMTMSKSYDFVLGYESRHLEGMSISLETYYKIFRDILYFKNEITYTKDVSELFYSGTGRALGGEIFIQKKVGDLTGMIGYTLAWTYRKYPQLNNGEEFQPKYDRRNDVTFAANYQLDENWKFGTVFTYATGQAYTQAVGEYSTFEQGIRTDRPLAGPLFNRRLSPYHRMDVSITKRASFFGLHGSWYFQIFNIYNRRNVWFKAFDTSKNPTEITDVKLLPIIPTFGLDFSF